MQLPQREMADLVGVSRSTLRRYRAMPYFPEAGDADGIADYIRKHGGNPRRGTAAPATRGRPSKSEPEVPRDDWVQRKLKADVQLREQRVASGQEALFERFRADLQQQLIPWLTRLKQALADCSLSPVQAGMVNRAIDETLAAVAEQVQAGQA